MASNDTLGGLVTGGQADFVRRVEALERRVRELGAVRSLSSSSLDAGGITVNPGGTSVALRVEQYDGSLGGAAGPAGTLAFALQTGEVSRLRLIDAGLATTAVTILESVPDGTGATTGASLSPQNGFYAVAPAGPGAAGRFYNLSLGGSASQYGEGFSVQAGTSYFQVNSDGYLGLNTLRLQSTSTEWRAQDNTGAYVPLRASSFPTSSSRGVKQDVQDLPFDPLDAVMAAPAFRWQYKPQQALDVRHHISPMADDLPSSLVEGAGAEMNVDTRDLVGVLWAAVRELTSRVVEADKRRNTLGQAPTPSGMAVNATKDVDIPLAKPMSTDVYDVVAVPPAGFTATVKAKTKTTVTVTLKATVAVSAASVVAVVVSS